jgi:hypoxanthine phosphoribosyltransferase
MRVLQNKCSIIYSVLGISRTIFDSLVQVCVHASKINKICLLNTYLLSLHLIFKTKSMIQLHDKQFVPFISEQEIAFAIAKMAAQVQADFADETPVFVGVLNGAFMVVSDFMKHYKRPCEVSFIKMASYEGTTSTDQVKQLIGINHDLSGRTVIILEDIVDTGNTVVALKELFKKQNVKHFKIATLFFKPEAYKKEVKIDYVGIRIPNKFIVGYGLDYNGLGRNLPNIYQLKE